MAQTENKHMTFEDIFTGETETLEIPDDFIFEPIPNITLPAIIDNRVRPKEQE